MSIRGVCPSCGEKYKLPDKLEGRVVPCEDCGADLIVGSDEKPSPKKKRDEGIRTVTAAPPMRKQDRSRRRDLDDDDRPARRGPRSSSGMAPLFWILGGGTLLVVLVACLGIGGLLMTGLIVAPGRQVVQIDPPPMPPPIVPVPGGGKPPPEPPKPPDPIQLPVVPWKVQADPGPDMTRPPQNAAGVLPLTGSPEVVFPSTPSPFVAVRQGPFGQEMLQVVDLHTFKPGAPVKSEAKVDLSGDAALSPDGKFLLAKGPFQPNVTAINVISLTDGRVVKTIQLDTNLASLMMFDFAENGHILTYKTRGITGHYEIYNIATGQEVRRFTVEGLLQKKNNLAFSPGRKYLAVAHKDQIDLYRPLTGEIAGSISMPGKNSSFKALAFSHDGKELACLLENFGSSSRLLTWKLADGKAGVDHKFAKDVHTLVKHAFGYKGEIMEWVPDGSGWLLYGQLWVDYQSGAPVHTIDYPAGEFRYWPRRFLGTGHVVHGGGDFAKMQIGIRELPAAEIAANIKNARGGAGQPVAAMPDAKIANLGAARNIAAPAGFVPWKFEADPAPEPKVKFAPLPIPLRGKAPEIVNLLFSSADAGKAVVLSGTTPNPLSPRRHYHADRYDLVDGKFLDGVELFAKDHMQPVFPNLPRAPLRADLSPDGARLIVRQPDDAKRVDVWNLAEGKHLIGLRTADHIDGVAMVAADRVLISSGGKLVLWTIPECQAIYAANGYSGGIHLSPGRKYAAVAGGAGVRLVEIATGECKGQLDQPGEPIGAILAGAFSRDGKEFAAATGGKVARWNLVQGKWLGACQGAQGDKPLAFMGPHVIQYHTLYDWNLKGPLWRYALPGQGIQGTSTPDGRHWFASNAKGVAMLNAQTLPDAAATNLAAQVAAGKVQPVVAPGMAIQLQVNAAAEKFRAASQTALHADWQAKGFKIGPGGLTVTLSAEERATGQMIIYDILGKANAVKVNEREVFCQYTITDAQGAVVGKSETAYKYPATIRFEGNDYERQLNEVIWRNAESFGRFVPLPTNQFRIDGKVETLPKFGPLKGGG